jgi:hypothetical protein
MDSVIRPAAVDGARLVYQPPSGPAVEAPAEKYLRQCVMEADVTYWDGPNGAHAGLSWEKDVDPFPVLTLVLTMHAGEYCVCHMGDQGASYLAAAPPRDPIEWVPVWMCQDFVPLGRRFLVPKEMAWKAVAEFLRTGRPAGGLRWEADTVEIGEPISADEADAMRA